MRYTLKNLGPGNFFSVEVGKLLQPGESVPVNRLDYGTRRLAEPPKPRLQIIDHAGARLEPAGPAGGATHPHVPSAPATPAAQPQQVSAVPAPQQPSAPTPPEEAAAGKTGRKAAPPAPKRDAVPTPTPAPASAPTTPPTAAPAAAPVKGDDGVVPSTPVVRTEQNI
jgi:hypothetical protein